MSVKVKKTISDLIINRFAYILVSIYAIACVVPFLLIIGTSFSTEDLVHQTGFTLIPKGPTLDAYRTLFMHGSTVYQDIRENPNYPLESEEAV